MTTYTLYSSHSGKLEVVGHMENLEEKEMRLVASVFGFRKKRVDRLVNHTNPKYCYIWKKDYQLEKKITAK